MTTTTQPASHTPAALVEPFPVPGPLLRNTFRELMLAEQGDPDMLKVLGPVETMQRPWEPATCHGPGLRAELWAWLDEVVAWLNAMYSWDAEAMIPACWPAHPHLVTEVAVIADQRRRASMDLTSTSLEEWHRYCLPPFIDRMRTRLAHSCGRGGHEDRPGAARLQRYRSPTAAQDREARFTADLACTSATQPVVPPGGRRMRVVTEAGVVDPDTGHLQ